MKHFSSFVHHIFSLFYFFNQFDCTKKANFLLHSVMCVFFCIAFSLFHLLLRFFFIFSAPYPRLKKTIMLDELSRDRMNESYEEKKLNTFSMRKIKHTKEREKDELLFCIWGVHRIFFFQICSTSVLSLSVLFVLQNFSCCCDRLLCYLR